MRKLIALAAPLGVIAATVSLGGCGKADSEPGPGGVTVGEAKALDEAAAMLDERRPPAEALDPSMSLAASEAPAEGADETAR